MRRACLSFSFNSGLRLTSALSYLPHPVHLFQPDHFSTFSTTPSSRVLCIRFWNFTAVSAHAIIIFRGGINAFVSYSLFFSHSFLNPSATWHRTVKMDDPIGICICVYFLRLHIYRYNFLFLSSSWYSFACIAHR